MAVFTHLDKAEIGRLLDAYDLPPLLSCEGISAGVTNTNYLLSFEHLKTVLTILEKGETKEEAEFFIELMNYCGTHGLKSPHVIVRKDGSFMTLINNKPAFIISFLPGESPSAINEALAEAAGQTLATFHVMAHQFPRAFPNRFAPHLFREKYIDPANSYIKKQPKDFQDRLQQALITVDALATLPLPRGICFLDLFPDNIFFKDGKFSGLIDFYYAATDYYAYDFMITLNAWCFDKPHMSFNKKLAAAFFKGYESIRPLTAEEKKHLPLMGQLAAMRILCSRLYEKAMLEKTGNKMHDPMQYDTVLRFHLNIKSADEYVS